MRRLLLLILTAAVTLPVIGPGVVAAAEATVTLTDRATPSALTVAPGTAVTFRNDGGERRRIRSEDGPAEFDSGNLEPGMSWVVTLDAAGTYAYVDDRDDENTAFHGTISVSTSAPPAPGSPPPAGGGGGTAAPAPAPPASASVAILDRSFSPASVTVAPGGTVTWANQSGREHTATGPGFDSGVIAEGGRFAHTFAAAGTYAYICDIHPEMRASVVVTAGGSAAPPAVAPPPAAPVPVSPPAPSSGAGAGTGADPAAAAPGAPAPARHDVAVIDYAFRPGTLSARVGDTVVWTNQGRAAHTATAPGAFDTGVFRAGEQRTTRLTAAGTFAFRCNLHPEMTGTITVAAASPGTALSRPSGGSGTTTGSATPAGAGPAAADAPAPSPAGSGPAETPRPVEVRVVDFAFEPGDVRVAAGGSVVWRLRGTAPHTVSARDGAFDSGLLEPGGSFTRRFDEVGTFAYVCAYHPDMQGTVEVVPASAGGGADGGAGLALGAGTAAPASSTGSGSGSTLLAGLLGGAALLAGTGALLFGSSRMMAAERA